MIFRRTKQFKDDYKNLDAELQKEVDKSFPDVVKAFEGDVVLNRRYDLHPLIGWNEIFAGHIKSNLCFTYQVITEGDEEKIVFFRRVGTHKIYKDP